MWAWILSAKNALGKFSVTAMLREQLALSEARAVKLDAENVDLKAQVASLTAELKLTRETLEQEKEKHDRLKKEHEEEIRIVSGVEFRYGRRTGNHWLPFCPKCHTPIFPHNQSIGFACLGGCGWHSPISSDDVADIANKGK